MKRIGLILALLLVFVAVAGVAAQDDTPPVDPGQVPTLPAFLELLAGPAGWVALGAFCSALLAQWPWYNTQGPGLKRALPMALAVAIALASRLLLTYVPANFWDQTAVYWYIVAGSLMTWLGTQGWFQAVIKPNRRALTLE